MDKEIFLVLSQSGSFLSRILKVVTRYEFNHISISLNSNLDPMYSFGRRQPYNPFWGGFVKEYLWKGTFYRFPSTKCQILKLSVSPEQHSALFNFLETMYQSRKQYGYNFVGLCFAGLNIPRPSNKKFYCSEFLRALLLQFEIPGAKDMPVIAHPCHFLDFQGVESVYYGLLRDYPNAKSNNKK